MMMRDFYPELVNSVAQFEEIDDEEEENINMAVNGG
jgi:hypothetical protein